MADESIDARLAKIVSSYWNDPLGYVLFAWDWQNDTSIQMVELPEKYKKLYPGAVYGPDLWACEVMERIRDEVIRNDFNGRDAVPSVNLAIASGHGIGKSCLTAWLVNWILDTRYGAKGMVTANTGAQLKSKTWAEITKWGKKKITAHWWSFKSMEITRKFAPEAWRLDAVTWDEKKSEAFAGQHSASSSSFYVFDEASNVPDSIWEVAKGGLTDGEPFFFVFGNPTRNTGAFYDCFHEKKAGWITANIDSRSVSITNKDEIERMRLEYGEDSDFFKVRVKGEFPTESSNLFISKERSLAAAQRPEPERYENQVAFLGVDVARYGGDRSVLQVRFGRNAKMPAEQFSKTSIVETARRVAAKINELKETYQFQRVLTFVDGGGVGGGVVDVLRDWGFEDIYDVNFGGAADDKARFANKRSEMWSRLNDWLLQGSIVNDPELIEQLSAPEYYYNKATKLTLESKEDMKRRGVDSPDWADALALTFFLGNTGFSDDAPRKKRHEQAYDPFSSFEASYAAHDLFNDF